MDRWGVGSEAELLSGHILQLAKEFRQGRSGDAAEVKDKVALEVFMLRSRFRAQFREQVKGEGLPEGEQRAAAERRASAWRVGPTCCLHAAMLQRVCCVNLHAVCCCYFWRLLGRSRRVHAAATSQLSLLAPAQVRRHARPCGERHRRGRGRGCGRGRGRAGAERLPLGADGPAGADQAEGALRRGEGRGEQQGSRQQRAEVRTVERWCKEHLQPAGGCAVLGSARCPISGLPDC